MSDTHSEAARSMAFVRKTEAPLLPPPPSEIGWRHWLRQNVFASMTDFSSIGASILSLLMIALTIGIVWFFVPVIWNLFSFSFLNAAWADPDDAKRLICATTQQGGERAEDWFGACWPFVDAKWKLYVYGRYPEEELWRPNLCFVLLALGVGWCVMDALPNPRLVGWALIALGVAMAIIYFLRQGGLPTTATEEAGLWDLIRRGDYLWTRTGFLIPFLIGVLYVALGRPVGRRWVLGLMVTVFPVIAFLLLTGGDLEVGRGTWTLWGGVALALLVLGWLGARGAGGEALAVFSGLFRSAGWLLVAVLIAVFVNSSLFVDLWEVMNGHVAEGEAAAGAFGAATPPGERLSWPLPTVETSDWGGLLVTLVVALTGIVASLPLGIVLALGRRSSLPAVRILSIAFIEFWRGVPLITVLFMSSVMLPLFLPEGAEFNKLLRALIGVALFSSAYMAEVIRGGLQAISKGQYEGGDSLGLSYWQKMRLIILPQALTLVIPGIVNTFIGLFKDTTLVLIIGLFDLLGSVQSSFTDSGWSTPVQSPTGYLVAGAVFWIFCFGMSRYSMYMERALYRGNKR